MRLVKWTISPVDQQGNWLGKINAYLSKAISVEMHTKACGSCGEDRTIVIYAVLEGVDGSVGLNGVPDGH